MDFITILANYPIKKTPCIFTDIKEENKSLPDEGTKGFVA